MRHFWDFAFENPEKIKPSHCALYAFCVEHCNRLGWKEKFGLPSQMAKEAIGIKSYKTYIHTLRDLRDWGFLVILENSYNQYSSNIIALVNFTEAHTKALDKAITKASPNHVPKQAQTKYTIDRPNNLLPITTTPVTKVLLKKEPKAKFPFRDKLIEIVGDEKIVDTWLLVRKQHRVTNSEIAFETTVSEIKKTGRTAKECVKKAASDSWKHIKANYFPPLKPYEVQANKKQQSPPEIDKKTEQKSLSVYRECLKNKTEWTDTPQLAAHIVKFLEPIFSIGEKNEIERIGKEAHEADRRKFGGYDYAKAICYVNSGLTNNIEI